MTSYADEILMHYIKNWGGQPIPKPFGMGPIAELPAEFQVLEFSPHGRRSMWTYATCSMSDPTDTYPLELHLFSPVQSELHVELLSAICHYHRRGVALSLWHTINFGRPWLPNSICEYGLISLPYLDGPAVEKYTIRQGGAVINFLWLLPITRLERDYKQSHGVEALEIRFQDAKLNYLDAKRRSVV